MPDRRKEFKQRLARMDDKQIEELAGDLVDFAERKGTSQLKNFIVDSRLRMILENMDQAQLKSAIRRSAATAALSTGVTALLSGLTSGPVEGVGAAITQLPMGLSGGYAAGKRKSKVRKVASVLREIRDRG